LPQTTVVASGGAGSAIQLFAVPAGLTGVTYYAQWAVENPPNSGTLGSLTQGLSVIVQ
jgi:hypothetical protein